MPKKKIMKYKLMFSNKGWWKQISASDDFDKLIAEAEKLDPILSWMIVEEKRYHIGAHSDSIGSDEIEKW